MLVRRTAILSLLLATISGCDMLGEYEARKQATKARLMSAPPAGQANPAVAQPMPGAPMPMAPMP